MDGRRKSVGGMSMGRRRRASVLGLFGLGGQSTDMGSAASENGDESVPASARGEPKRNASLGRKSRRASVMDFFRGTATGMLDTDPSLGDRGGDFTARSGPGSTSRGRRRSVIDILGHSSKKVRPVRCALSRMV